MGQYYWSGEKNKKLIQERQISFEEIVLHIEEGYVLAESHGKGKHKNQTHLIIEVNQYAYIVPIIESKEGIFLKTIIPSRKMTAKYLKGGENNAT